jgi:hypothetical protein
LSLAYCLRHQRPHPTSCHSLEANDSVSTLLQHSRQILSVTSHNRFLQVDSASLAEWGLSHNSVTDAQPQVRHGSENKLPATKFWQEGYLLDKGSIRYRRNLWSCSNYKLRDEVRPVGDLKAPAMTLDLFFFSYLTPTLIYASLLSLITFRELISLTPMFIF